VKRKSGAGAGRVKRKSGAGARRKRVVRSARPARASAAEVRSSAAPLPVGPYSQAVAAGGLLFLSGQIPLDPHTQKLVAGEIEEQTVRVIENLAAVLAAGGSSLARVVRTTVYLKDLALFPRMNAVYARYFEQIPQPARATIQAAALPLGAQIEIDAIALCPRARAAQRKPR
jgi:2-iminobutanoate/2-iminopropanoate deaminase